MNTLISRSSMIRINPMEIWEFIDGLPTYKEALL